MRKVLFGLVGLILVAVGFYFLVSNKNSVETPLPEETLIPFYRPAENINAKVTVVTEKLPQISTIEITSDGKYMFAANLTGNIWVFQKIDGKFVQQEKPFFELETGQPGFPPEEAGLTGIILGADFETSGDIFLTYSFAESEGVLKNRVTKIKFTLTQTGVVGENPTLVFEANALGGPSHQIQDGVGLLVNGKPHIMFSVGEGFKAERALDPLLEAGKVILIQADGKAPEGLRPYPNSPKVQAVGVRNAPAIAYNPKTQKFALVDTGPSVNDRFLYGKLLPVDGNNSQPLSFNWDGSDESLAMPAFDPYTVAKQDMVLYRWSPTETAVNVAFYENESLPKLNENEQYVLVSIFGMTGSLQNTSGKKILLGTITHGDQDKIQFQTLIERADAGEGKLGHPLGLAIDPQTKDVYFGDILEGRIYKVAFN